LLVPQGDDYASGKPRPGDVLLLVEVADSSLDYDRDVKGPLYAENGIVEYWIANVIDRSLEVYRDPRADGTYADVRTLRAGEAVTLVALPTITVSVADLF
jgi:Uma2 family endonuclease